MPDPYNSVVFVSSLYDSIQFSNLVSAPLSVSLFLLLPFHFLSASLLVISSLTLYLRQQNGSGGASNLEDRNTPDRETEVVSQSNSLTTTASAETTGMNIKH